MRGGGNATTLAHRQCYQRFRGSGDPFQVRAVHLSQPSLTVQIRQLEQSLGVHLVDRTRGRQALPRWGRELLPTFRQRLAELDAVVSDTRDIGSKKRGIVRLASLPSFAAILPSAVAGFCADYAAIQFVIRATVDKRIASLVKDGDGRIRYHRQQDR